MKILIIGGSGTIGQPVADHFSKDNEVIIASRNSDDLKIDIADSASINAQIIYLSANKIHIFLLILGAGLAVNPLPTT